MATGLGRRHRTLGQPDAKLHCEVSAASRKSLALYYYTVDRNSRPSTRSTDYRARLGDSLRKATLIWLDKQAVHLYSKAKVRFGFSDRVEQDSWGSLQTRRPRCQKILEVGLTKSAWMFFSLKP